MSKPPGSRFRIWSPGPLPAGVEAVQEPLIRFFRAARGAGVRISPAESIDALRAVEIVGYADRTALRDALALSLAKTLDEKQALEACFDLYFSAGTPPGPAAEQAAPESDRGDLTQMLSTGDRAALGTAMAEAAEAAGLAEIRLFTQVNQFARRILEGMGLDRLERDIAALAATAPETARTLQRAREALGEQVRELVDRNLVLFSRGETESLREEALRNARLTALDRRDLARMRVIVRAMAKRLRDRYARPRRRRRRGQLDARRTIRGNAGWGGIPFITHWKQRHVEKPRLMVLCDVSGSVAAAAEFLLLFLYALNEALSDIRAFAFSGSLIEVSQVLETLEIDAAIGEVLRRIGFGSSNYGRALADFETGWMASVTRRTSVLILGDGRGNFTDPRTDILKRIGERAKRVIWLNPEARASWGTGDSDMLRYAPYCTLVTQCNTLKRLERVVAELLGAQG
jgi:uncharacterized protein with von Willebrand factor type A (vWA) domain